MEAQARGDDTVTPEHLLSALLVEPEVTSALASLGTSATAVRDRLDESWPGPPVEVAMAEWKAARVSTGVIDVVRSAARAANRLPLSPAPAAPLDLLCAIADLTEGAAPSVLSASRITRTRLAGLGAHNAQLSTARPLSFPYRDGDAAAAEVQVRIFDDERTTMAFVTQLLVATFGKSPSEARFVMLRTHRMGSAIVGKYEPERAKQLVEQATTAARGAGFPLRVALEPELGPLRTSIWARLFAKAHS